MKNKKRRKQKLAAASKSWLADLGRRNRPHYQAAEA